jgi:hypothetical protein
LRRVVNSAEDKAAHRKGKRTSSIFSDSFLYVLGQSASNIVMYQEKRFIYTWSTGRYLINLAHMVTSFFLRILMDTLIWKCPILVFSQEYHP